MQENVKPPSHFDSWPNQSCGGSHFFVISSHHIVISDLVREPYNIVISDLGIIFWFQTWPTSHGDSWLGPNHIVISYFWLGPQDIVISDLVSIILYFWLGPHHTVFWTWPSSHSDFRLGLHTLTATTCGALFVLLEPVYHVCSVTTMSTPQTESRVSFDTDVTDGAVEGQTFTWPTLRSTTLLVAVITTDTKLYASMGFW